MHTYTEFSPQVVYLVIHNELKKKKKISPGIEVLCVGYLRNWQKAAIHY